MYKKCGGLGSNDKGLAPMAIEKTRILGVVLEPPAKLQGQFSPYSPFLW